MTIFKRIIDKLKVKKKINFNSLFHKLKILFKLNNWKSRVLVLASLIILITTSLFVVYGQTGGSNTDSSLTKGLIAYYTLDNEDYEAGTVNLAPNTNYANRTYNQIYSPSCWGGDAATIEYFSSGGYNNLPYKKLIKTGSGTGGCFVDEHYGINIENNKTYIVSAYLKASRNISGIQPYVIGLNRTVDNAYRNGPTLNLTTEWQRYSWVYNTGADHAGIYSNRGIVYEDNSLPLEVYWSGFQVQEASSITPYVNGTRADRVVDKTAYSNHGTNYGAASTTDRHGKLGGAMNFDGVDDYITIEPVPFNTNISVSLWFNRKGTVKTFVPLLEQGGTKKFRLVTYNNKICFGADSFTDNFYCTNEVFPDLNYWYNVIAVYDGSYNIFVNGIKYPLTQTTGNYGSWSVSKLNIGYRPYTSIVGPMNGAIDDVRIYNRGISESEVATLYGSYEPKVQISSTNAGLVGHWTLSEEDYNAANNRVTDKTPYENHGTNSGATLTTDRHGKTNGAMSFNGSDINIANNNSLNTESLSISFWAYHRNYTYPKTFGAIKKSSPNCYAVGGKGWDFGHGYNANGIDVCLNDGVNVIRTPLYFNAGSRPSDLLNKWTHIVYIINRSQKKVLAYINGVKQSAEVDISSITGDINNSSTLTIGTLYGWSVDGILSDVRMYNKVLSQEEVSLLYNSYTPQTGSDSLQKGLILDMPLNTTHLKTETSGSQIINDKTPYNNYGVNSGAVISSDKASFNGSDSGITIDNFPQIFNGSVTLSTWAYFNDDTRGIIFGNYSSAVNINLEKHTSRRLRFYWNNGQVDAYSSINAFELNNWNHLVLMRNKELNRFEFWVNGSLVNTVNGVGTDLASVNSNTFRIGRDTRTGETVTNGSYADLKIYNRALSAEEIKSLYDKTAFTVGGQAIYRKSCKEILEANPSNPSGVYQIRPILAEAAFSVYCDMDTDGGGWTLIEKDYGGSATVPVSSANDTNTAILTDQTWSTAEGKFADSKIKAIWLAGNRELLWRKSTGEYVKMRFSADFINSWFSNFSYFNRPTSGIFQEFYRYADSTWYAINGHNNNWHFSNYNDGMNVSPYSSYRQAKNQSDGDAYWPTRSSGLMDNTSFMFHMYIR